MSSAENGKLAGRLVWITEDLAITIFAALHAHRPSSRDEFDAAWDAAPADPAVVIVDWFNDAFAMDDEPMHDIADIARDLLGALGVPPEREE